MGDRTSVQFVEGRGEEEELSVVICDHWGGKEFPKLAQEFVRTRGEPQDALSKLGCSTPQTRRDVPYFTVEFLQWVQGKASVYVGVDQNHVDNSDNGNYVIDVQSGEIVRREKECYCCGQRGIDVSTMKERLHPSFNFKSLMCKDCVELTVAERESLYYSTHEHMVAFREVEEETTV